MKRMLTKQFWMDCLKTLPMSLVLSFGIMSAPVWAATISVDSLMSFLIWIIVIGLIFWLLWWLLQQVGLPEPFNKVARIVLAVIAVLVCINLLLGLAGTPLLTFR